MDDNGHVQPHSGAKLLGKVREGAAPLHKPLKEEGFTMGFEVLK